MILGSSLNSHYNTTMRHYTIVNADDFVNADEFTWGTLFESLDSIVAALGYTIDSGKYVSEDPYVGNLDFVRVILPRVAEVESGQLIELTPVATLWGL